MSETVDLKQYKLIEQIGKGENGIVYKVEKISNKKIYAAKVSKLSYDEDAEDEDQRFFLREIYCHQMLDNEAVIKFHGYSLKDFDGNNYPVILTEFMDEGDLHKILRQVRNGERTGWNNTKMIINIIGISIGMKYLHDNGIVHRNLKPSNILLDENLYPKIADFNYSRYLNANTINLTHFVGTPIYMAPEIADDDIYTFKVDVFSFSMILYELYTNSRPMVNGKTAMRVIRNITKGDRPDETKLPEGPIKELIIRCWSKDPEKRPTFDDFIHYFIENRDDFWPEDVDEYEVEKYLSKFGLSFDQDQINDFFVNHKKKIIYNDENTLLRLTQKKLSKEKTTNNDYEKDSDDDSNDELIKRKPTSSDDDESAESDESEKDISKIFISQFGETVDLKQYKLIEQIGSGCYGHVYKVEKISNKKIYAAKVMILIYDKYDDEYQRFFLREIHCHQMLDNEAIIKFYGYSLKDFDGNSHPVILTKFMDEGDLNKILKKVRNGERTGWNNTKMIINIIGISIGMKYLHDNGIVHRNLKPSNILLDENLYPKIADFGSSRLLDENVTQLTHFIGTPIYMAPEVAGDDIYTFKVDVFSFSMILYELYTNSRPIVNGNAIFHVIQNMIKGDRPNETKLPEGPIKELIIKCWSEDPEKRPTFDDIIHYFIENRDDFWPEDVDEYEVEKYLSKFGLSFDQDKINDFFIKHTPKKKNIDDDDEGSLK